LVGQDNKGKEKERTRKRGGGREGEDGGKRKKIILVKDC
jgi:hypothetical protein